MKLRNGHQALRQRSNIILHIFALRNPHPPRLTQKLLLDHQSPPLPHLILFITLVTPYFYFFCLFSFLSNSFYTTILYILSDIIHCISSLLSHSSIIILGANPLPLPTLQVSDRVFDTFRTFFSIEMCIIYREDTLNFATGIQNVFLVEVSNRNYALHVFCIPRLCLGHKKHVGHNSYIQ